MRYLPLTPAFHAYARGTADDEGLLASRCVQVSTSPRSAQGLY